MLLLSLWLIAGTYRLSHNLLNFWNKLHVEFSTSGLDNYAALCNIHHRNSFSYIFPFIQA